jgi:hypothetical protein
MVPITREQDTELTLLKAKISTGTMTEADHVQYDRLLRLSGANQPQPPTFTQSDARIYPGYEQLYIHLPNREDGEDRRTIYVYRDADNHPWTTNVIKRDIGSSTFMKVSALVNEQNYAIYITHTGENILDYENQATITCPSKEHLAYARSKTEGEDIGKFYTLLFNMVTQTRSDFIFTYHGPDTFFGEEDDSAKRLTAIQVKRAQVLEKEIHADTMSTTEWDEYALLMKEVRSGHTPTVTYKILERQPMSADGTPFGNDRNLEPRLYEEKLDPVTEEYQRNMVSVYDNMVEMKIYSRDPGEADEITLFLQYLIEDNLDYFAGNGIPLVYFWNRTGDSFESRQRIGLYVRTLRFFVRCQRVTQESNALIKNVKTSIYFPDADIDASILIDNEDF